MAEPDRPPGQRSLFNFGVRVAEKRQPPEVDRAEVERDVEAKRQARKQREQDAAAAANPRSRCCRSAAAAGVGAQRRDACDDRSGRARGRAGGRGRAGAWAGAGAAGRCPAVRGEVVVVDPCRDGHAGGNVRHGRLDDDEMG
jgi:hypothetical protein